MLNLSEPTSGKFPTCIYLWLFLISTGLRTIISGYFEIEEKQLNVL